MGGMIQIEKKKDDMGLAYEPDEPRYPYGTDLDFRDELVDELGLDSCSVGDEVLIVAKAVVIRKSERSSESADGEADNSKNVELQLVEVKVDKPSGGDRADKMYGEE